WLALACATTAAAPTTLLGRPLSVAAGWQRFWFVCRQIGVPLAAPGRTLTAGPRALAATARAAPAPSPTAGGLPRFPDGGGMRARHAPLRALGDVEVGVEVRGRGVGLDRLRDPHL